jgi:hypothetical protein
LIEESRAGVQMLVWNTLRFWCFDLAHGALLYRCPVLVCRLTVSPVTNERREDFHGL